MMMGFGLIWVVVIVVVVAVLVGNGSDRISFRGRSGRQGNTADEEPRVILDERYARGEITRDEYLRMKEDLE